MPYKDPEKQKAYSQEYRKKYREEHGERLNREKREHYAKYLAHPKVLLTPEQKRENTLASYKRANAKRKDALKQYRKDNREKLRAYANEWYSKNKERMVEWRKQYYQENKEHISKRRKQWFLNNEERFKKQAKEWRIANKERIAKKNKEYRPIASIKRLDCPSYAKQCLKKGTNLRNKDIPNELAQAKLIQILIQRKLKNEERNGTA